MSTLELRHVLRRLARSPLFTVLTIATLAIGIGADTAIFSVLNGVLLKPLPYPESDRLVSIWETARGLGIPELNSSPATYFTFREEGKTFEDVALWRHDAINVTGLAEPEQVEALNVTDGLLPILRVQPVRGRAFSKKDDQAGSQPTVMLSYGYWQRRFGGQDNAVGRTLILDGKQHEIIGVLPQDFRFMNSNISMVTPLQFNRGEVFVGNFSYQSVARLKPGVSLEQVNADVGRMLPMLPIKFKLPPGFSLQMLQSAQLGPNARWLKKDVVGDVGNVLWVLMGTVAIVLLIACANVANLLLVRADGRQQELAVRAALGASRGQLAFGLLLESVLLGVAGGVAGLGLAWAGLKFLVYLGPSHLPRLHEIVIDARVLLFTLAVSIVAGILFGLVPVFKYGWGQVALALRQGGRNASEGRERHRARGALVIVQVALALVLLISSGLMIRTFQALRSVQPGFRDPQQIQTVRVTINSAQIPEPARVVRMHRDMLEKIAAIPGVQMASSSNSITMDGNDNNDPLFREDRPTEEGTIPPIRRYKSITPGYFQTMGNPLVAGRDYNWADIEEMRPVLILSENLAREFWGSPAAAIGKRLRENPKGIWREVVGVVGNERDNGMDQKAPTIAYWPMAVREFWGEKVNVRRSMAFAIRTSRAGSSALMDEVRQAIWSVNRDLPLADVRTVKEIADRSMARTSFTLVMLAIAASMALLLGIVGIYGVISYSVTQRTREIGIRMALGADRGSVRTMFVRHAMFLAGIGVACGLVAAAAVTQAMQKVLFEVNPIDPVTYLAVSAVLLLAALAAGYVPARRATTIEPLEALRTE